MLIGQSINNEQSNPYPKKILSQALGYARNNHYYQSKKAVSDRKLANRIEIEHQEDDTLGYRKLAALIVTNGKRIRRVMRKYGLKARRKKKKYIYPGKASQVADNLANDSIAREICEILFSDIFELKLQDGSKIRGCFVIHYKTRQVLSLVFDYGMPAELVVRAIERVDFIDPLTLFHSDQGKQYGAKKTFEALTTKGFIASMSRAGTPTDNPIAERFVGLFKLAVVDRYSYETLGDFLKEAERWINYYNQKRPHSSLGQIAPAQYALQNNYKIVSYLSLS